jgi:hypothetical protein
VIGRHAICRELVQACPTFRVSSLTPFTWRPRPRSDAAAKAPIDVGLANIDLDGTPLSSLRTPINIRSLQLILSSTLRDEISTDLAAVNPYGVTVGTTIRIPQPHHPCCMT